MYLDFKCFLSFYIHLKKHTKDSTPQLKARKLNPTKTSFPRTKQKGKTQTSKTGLVMHANNPAIYHRKLKQEDSNFKAYLDYAEVKVSLSNSRPCFQIQKGSRRGGGGWSSCLRDSERQHLLRMQRPQVLCTAPKMRQSDRQMGRQIDTDRRTDRDMIYMSEQLAYTEGMSPDVCITSNLSKLFISVQPTPSNILKQARCAFCNIQS